jgi:hypothetical protein
MAEENAVEKNVEELKEMTPEERAAAWEKWVVGEVNAALGIYLPISKSGNIGLRYTPHVVEVLESGPVTTDSKADGVLISVYFDFEAPLDLTKPRTETEEE